MYLYSFICCIIKDTAPYTKTKNNEIALYGNNHSAKTFERPEFKKLPEFAKKNKNQINYLLIIKWDRFLRNTTDSLNMLRTFDKLGIKIDAAEQPIDLSIPENKLMLSLYLTAPEVENNQRAMNTTTGMPKAQKEGKYVSTAPYGFKNTRDESNRTYYYPFANGSGD